MNIGIEHSHGKLITFLSADDMMRKDRLEYLVRAWEQNQHSVIYDDQTILKNGKLGVVWQMQEYDFDTLIYKNQMAAGILHSRQAWKECGGYPDALRFGREDWGFNIALGLKGYCGVHVHEAGYYYRREGQNRTVRNKGPEWHEEFLSTMQKLFTEAYIGDKPIMCCGRGSSNGNRARMPSVSKKPLLGKDGTVMVRYMGGNLGEEVYYGEETGARYIFNAGRKQMGYVDKRDAPAILRLIQNRKPLFVVFQKKIELPTVAAMEQANPGSTVVMAAVDEVVPVKATRTKRSKKATE